MPAAKLLTTNPILEAAARHRGATWKEGPSPDIGAFMVRGRREAARLCSIGVAASRRSVRLPGLRYDRVALELIDLLRQRLAQLVPADRVLVVTVTAPIRQSGKTLNEIVDWIATAGLPGARTWRREILGNDIGVALYADAGSRNSDGAVVVFVHNPEAQPGLILKSVGNFLAALPASADPSTTLVMHERTAFPGTRLYRDLCAQLKLARRARVILLADQGASIETLVE